MSGPPREIVRPSKDELDREVIGQVSAAIAALNGALVFAADRKIRVEVGTVASDGQGKKARNWREPWFEDGLAVRFTREEIFASPKPALPVVDGEPRIGG
jgi:hypothetical protein